MRGLLIGLGIGAAYIGLWWLALSSYDWWSLPLMLVMTLLMVAVVLMPVLLWLWHLIRHPRVNPRICPACQGEYRAAMNRILGKH